jgi:hypothetical protein
MEEEDYSKYVANLFETVSLSKCPIPFFFFTGPGVLRARLNAPQPDPSKGPL